jgi:hypothetical protein
VSAPVSVSFLCLHQSPYCFYLCTSLRVVSVSAPVSILFLCLHQSPCRVILFQYKICKDICNGVLINKRSKTRRELHWHNFC